MNKRLFAILSIILVLACDETTNTKHTDDDKGVDQPIFGQKPMLSFIGLDSIVPGNPAIFIDETPFEFGTRMKFLKAGEISGIGVQMPDSGMYRLTIWSLADTSIVLTDSILVDSGEVKYKDISSIAVSANSEIRITVQSNDWYWFNHISNPSKIIFPDTITDIVLIDYSYIGAVVQTYPTIINYDYYAGHADIVFNPLE